MGVYKEGKNWKVQVYYKDWQGNQKRKQKRGFRTKGEAKEWERDFLQQQSQGVDIEFGNFLEIYYKDMDVRLREHTMYTKRYIIDLKIRPYFEKSQIAEALGKHLASDVFESYSAGTETKPQINQDAVRIMKKLYGIDMETNGQYSKLITDIPDVDIAISMGCNVGCPFIGRPFDDNWGLDDPTGKDDVDFIKVINQIELKIKNMIDRMK